jgi:hypothetical protein
MMDRDAFFSNLFNEDGDAIEAIRFQRQLSFEERTVKRAFTECGIKIKSWGMLVNQCKNETGLHKLNFNWFNSSYRFPARLCGRRIPKLHELTIHDLFKPKKNRLVHAVVKNLAKQEVDPDEKFVFVFPVTRKMFCAHNLTPDRSTGIDTISWQFKTDDWQLTVEPTVSFFGNLGADWFNV